MTLANDLMGRVAVVTGAAGGIGFQISQLPQEAGAHVHITDMDAAILARNAAELPAVVQTRVLDVSQPSEI